jgi:predicted RNA-binding protein
MKNTIKTIGNLIEENKLQEAVNLINDKIHEETIEYNLIKGEMIKDRIEVFKTIISDESDIININNLKNDEWYQVKDSVNKIAIFTLTKDFIENAYCEMFAGKL